MHKLVLIFLSNVCMQIMPWKCTSAAAHQCLEPPGCWVRACLSNICSLHYAFMRMSRLTDEWADEDENLNCGGEVPVGLLSDEPLLAISSGPLRRGAAVPPGRRTRRVQEIRPEVSCCEIGSTVPDRRRPAADVHLRSRRDRYDFPYILRLAGDQHDISGLLLCLWRYCWYLAKKINKNK